MPDPPAVARAAAARRRTSDDRALAGSAACAAAALGLVALLSGCTGDPVPAQQSTAASSDGSAPSPSESLLPPDPATDSAVGELADGFPTDLIAVPEGSEILVSTAQLDEATGLATVSLNLRSPLPVEDLLETVGAPLVAAGFTQTPSDTTVSGLAAGSTFTRGDGGELLTAGVLDRDGVRTLTLGGTVRVGG